MELGHGKIIQKPKKQELFSLFLTPVKFHKYIPYSLGVMARTLLIIWMSRGNNSKTKNARVVFLVNDTSSQCDACTCKVTSSQCDACTGIVSWIYSIRFRSYGPDTVYYMEPSQGKIIQKQKNARVVFLVYETSSQCDACTCKVSWIYSIRFRSYGPDTKWDGRTDGQNWQG